MSQIAHFAFNGTTPETSLFTGVPEIANKLAARDIRTILSFDKEAGFDENGVIAHEFTNGGDAWQSVGCVALADTGVLVNRMGRSIKKDEVAGSEDLPPMVNENATRSLAYRKHRMANEVLLPLGLTMPTRLIEGATDIDEVITASAAKQFVLKPDNGTFSRGVSWVPRDSVAAYFANDAARFGQDIMQPAYDFTGAFPTELRPYDAASREGFDGWNADGHRKELRVYGFHSPEATTVFPIARAIDVDSIDQWFFVDPESVPGAVLKGAAMATAKAAEVSDAQAMFSAVDFGYGSLDGGDPEWQVIELNGKAPYMLEYNKHNGVADKLREQFADMLQQTINHNL